MSGKASTLTTACILLAGAAVLFAQMPPQMPPPVQPPAAQSANYVVGPQDVLIITSYEPTT